MKHLKHCETSWNSRTFDPTISALDAETSALDVETSAFGAVTSAIARRPFDETISALDAGDAVARCGDIGTMVATSITINVYVNMQTTNC